MSWLRIIILAAITTLAAVISATGAEPKRDFRGAWIQTIYQGYDKRSTAENKAFLAELLDRLADAGINAVIFQVRPRGDAFYRSDLEPWSKYLTGSTGKAPVPAWDPLQFMIDQCHSRGMELHAWLNPYRASTVADAASLPPGNIIKRRPDLFVRYGKDYYFNPAKSENRSHICDVVRDIVERYDIDGIHFDDYFYPYPIAGKQFPDNKDFAAAQTNMSRDDWRRHNVDLLIEKVSATIASAKPWVRFGISPFGIWRNSSNDPRGSNTRGLQNFDDLYADVPLWAEKGWIDYQAPQLYWPMDHRSAPYRELCDWWAENGRGRHVYIGQDAEKTAAAGELAQKLAMVAAHSGERLHGNCWWYAASLHTLAPELKRGAYAAPALVPEYLWKHADPADKPSGIVVRNGTMSWKRDPSASKWVVYRFDSEIEIDIDNPAAICAVVYTPAFAPKQNGYYIVTALDRANGESAPSTPIKVTL